MRHQLEGRYAVLRFLAHLTPVGSQEGYRASVALPSSPPGIASPDYESRPALTPWRAARETLSRDADAPLPKWHLLPPPPG